ncbi:MAG: hypothetical protein PF488_02210 [Patescibacteria group bacterium]|jgi:cell division protein YceG involved in septum cleavage|nr:hypothetical protein [Patescibacteria group bacterium]
MQHKKKRLINKRKLLAFLKRKKNKRIMLISFLSIIFLIFLYYLLSFFFLSKFSVCLEKLKRTYSAEVICRDSCFLEREEYRSCISNRLDNKEINKEKIKQVIVNEEENTQLRKDLISILASVYSQENVPSFLNDYFLDENGIEEIKKEIVYSYDFSNGLNDYFYILENDFSLDVKRAAIVKISSWEKINDYSLKQVKRIEGLIFNETVNFKLRQDLVLLLANYQETFNEEVVTVWQKVYESTFINDNISRAFAADFLGKEEIELSEKEWQNYYTN